MNLEVKRRWLTSNSTCGELWIDGTLQCYTLEPRMDQSKGKPYAIPAGKYQLINRFSPDHKMNVPHVESVPGFVDIEMHIGNYPKDTLGCTLVGTTHTTDFVGGSGKAFSALVAKLTYPSTITYTDLPNV